MKITERIKLVPIDSWDDGFTKGAVLGLMLDTEQIGDVTLVHTPGFVNLSFEIDEQWEGLGIMGRVVNKVCAEIVKEYAITCCIRRDNAACRAILIGANFHVVSWDETHDHYMRPRGDEA